MASRIAAGEVVERPASVVKELLENSIDARATEITVSIEKSGTSLIRVTDDGEGISPEDLPLALERHATSKLRSDEDLFRISTLGFRGEALPSIASVSRFEITSRPAGYDSAYRLRVDGESKISAQMAAAATGTMIELKDLFYNVPARRKFLKSLPTEFSHICDIVNRLALAYPEIHFRLEHNGKTLIDFVAVRELRERLYQVLGREVADSLRPFEYRQGVLSVSGYLSSAPTAFPNSRHLMTFVNHRYVRDKILTHAVLHGYETLLMKGQYPAVVLLLDIPFDEVDVNVHPAKYEVRFRRQSDVHEAVARAIREALRAEAQQPSGRSFAPWPQYSSADMEAVLPYANSVFYFRGIIRFRIEPGSFCSSEPIRSIAPRIFFLAQCPRPNSRLLFDLFICSGFGADRPARRARTGRLRTATKADARQCSGTTNTVASSDGRVIGR